MEFYIVTLFPEFFEGFLKSSLLGKAIKNGVLNVHLVSLREFSENKHNRVDDRVFGGGPGMLLQVGPIERALNSIPDGAGHRLLTDPRGRLLDTAWAQKMADLEKVTIICGNYEGVDYRVNEHLVEEEVSIGNYITNGGESAAIVIIEAISRFLPGFMGKASSTQEESHDETGLLEYPQYTRPEDYNGWKVPEVLLSGNHGQIEKWREKMRHEMTRKRKNNGSSFEGN